MSTDNERDLRGRLDAALGTITPPGPPVGAVLRQGRSIRVRRRVGLAAGLAAVVGLGIALPGLVAHVGAEPPAQHSYKVTVNSPRSTPSKLTFSGTINGKPWRFWMTWQRGHRGHSGQIMQIGPGLPWTNVSDLSPGGQPAAFQAVEDGPREAMTGQVRGDITYLALNEPGGSTVDLTPVRWHGARWIAVEIPVRPSLRSIVAYSRSGEVAHAVPFGTSVSAWLRPGQRGLARQTARIATGTAGGQRWSFYGYAGPWGICLQDPSGTGDCLGAYGSRLRPGQLTEWDGCGSLNLSGYQLWNGQAAADVSYLKFRLSDGTVQRVVPVALAGYRYFALAFRDHQRLVSWTAYGASGRVLGNGSITPQC
jgi:hypothetical protein